MRELEKCPNCGKKANDTFSKKWFYVHTCNKCGEDYCDYCGNGNGEECPKCGSKDFDDYYKVYPQHK